MLDNTTAAAERSQMCFIHILLFLASSSAGEECLHVTVSADVIFVGDISEMKTETSVLL